MILEIKDRKSNELLRCLVEAVDMNWDGYFVLRYHIIKCNKQKTRFDTVRFIYDNDEFNRLYQVI